jgi:hypothetical protein
MDFETFKVDEVGDNKKKLMEIANLPEDKKFGMSISAT